MLKQLLPFVKGHALGNIYAPFSGISSHLVVTRDADDAQLIVISSPGSICRSEAIPAVKPDGEDRTKELRAMDLSLVHWYFREDVLVLWLARMVYSL